MSIAIANFDRRSKHSRFHLCLIMSLVEIRWAAEYRPDSGRDPARISTVKAAPEWLREAAAPPNVVRRGGGSGDDAGSSGDLEGLHQKRCCWMWRHTLDMISPALSYEIAGLVREKLCRMAEMGGRCYRLWKRLPWHGNL
jgi:hypothetical protein